MKIIYSNTQVAIACYLDYYLAGVHAGTNVKGVGDTCVKGVGDTWESFSSVTDPFIRPVTINNLHKTLPA